MTYYYYDNSASDSTARLERLNVPVGTTPSSLALVTTSGTGGFGSSSTTSIASPIIDNNNYQYNLLIQLPDVGLYIYGVKIEYTF
jgi:hypothetical protein